MKIRRFNFYEKTALCLLVSELVALVSFLVLISGTIKDILPIFFIGFLMTVAILAAIASLAIIVVSYIWDRHDSKKKL